MVRYTECFPEIPGMLCRSLIRGTSSNVANAVRYLGEII